MDKVKKSRYKMSVGGKIVVGVICAILVAYTFSVLFMLLWGLNTSLKNYMEIDIMHNYMGLPSLEYSKKELLFSNYSSVFKYLKFQPSVATFYSNGVLVKHKYSASFLGLLVNTLIFAGGGAILTTIIPAIVSYMTAKYKYKFSRIIYWFVVITMTIPVIGAYPSEIAFLRNSGLYDTYGGYLLQKSHFLGMYFLIFYAYFEGLSDSYMEAAEIDGASHFRVMWQVMMPLALKTISSVLLLQFVTFWNDYQTANLYMPSHPTIAYAVWRFSLSGQNQAGTEGAIMMKLPLQIASCMVLAIPITLVYVVFRDKLMGNLSMGGIKG